MSAWLKLNRRRAAVVLCVCTLHAVALYAMHAGLLRSELLETPVMISTMALIESAPATKVSPVAPPVPTQPKAVPKPDIQAVKPPLRQQARPMLQSQHQPLAQSVVPSQTAQSTNSAPAAANKSEPVVAPTASATGTASDLFDKTPAQPVLELPSSNASYLNNPKPLYPAMSKRLGEQGRVMLRVFINADGTPGEVQVLKSSGYDKLDQTAQDTVKRWRFVPGKRGGVPEGMWFNVPMNFVLD